MKPCYFGIKKIIGVQSNYGVEYFGGPAAPTGGGTSEQQCVS